MKSPADNPMSLKNLFLSPTNDSTAGAVAKTMAAWGLYLGSLNLHQWLQLVGLVVGIGYTATQWWLVLHQHWLQRKERAAAEAARKLDPPTGM